MSHRADPHGRFSHALAAATDAAPGGDEFAASIRRSAHAWSSGRASRRFGSCRARDGSPGTARHAVGGRRPAVDQVPLRDHSNLGDSVSRD
jgi:hypothetical protein